MIPVQHLNTRPVPDTTTQEPAVPTTYDVETITHRTHCFKLPVGPEGAPLGDVETVTGAAATAARQAWGIDETTALPGDALRYTIEAGALVVSFVTEERQA